MNAHSTRCASVRLLCVVMLAASSGCVTYERARPVHDARFDLLHARQLVTFEQRLASENQSGLDDTWTRLGEAWVKLANCQQIDPHATRTGPDDAVDPLAELLHATIVLEDIRRRRLIYHRATRFVPRSISQTIFAQLDDRDFFERKPPASLPDEVVQWPATQEAWADELPTYMAQPLQCKEMYRELVKSGRTERARYDVIQRKYRKARQLPNVDVVEVPPPRYRLLPSVEQLTLWQAMATRNEASQPSSPPLLELVEPPSLEDATGEDAPEQDASGESAGQVQVTEKKSENRDAFLALKPDDTRDPTLELPEDGTLANLYLREIVQANHVLRLGEALPDDIASLPSVDALLWRVRFHLVFMAGEHLRQLGAISRPSPREAALEQGWLELRRAWARPLAERELTGHAPQSAQVLSNWRIAPLLDYALQAEQERRYEDALGAYERIHDIGVTERNIWPARYLHLRLLSKLGKWEAMAPYTEELPPKTSTLYTPYLWHVSRALFATGQYDRFLAVALDAMRDRPYQSDPFMRAVYLKLLATLTETPFESRTVELLEDMGPRSTTFDRVEAYAAVSLDRGKPENARAAAKWLLGKHLNANYRPRYHAILALAAFLEDDLDAFSTALDAVVERPADLVEAIGVGRRGSFFINADEQLARVFREMLPVMAEWGDGPQAVALRQKWLEVITLRAQSFLQNSPETLARPALVELYRIASGMLESDSPRAYPERVGALEPEPLVLGTVKVGERDLDRFEPFIRTYHEPVASLTLIPRDDVPVADWIEWFEPTRRDMVEGVQGSSETEVRAGSSDGGGVR